MASDKYLAGVEELWPKLDPHSKQFILAVFEMAVDCNSGKFPAQDVKRIDRVMRSGDYRRIEKVVVEFGYLQSSLSGPGLLGVC